MLPIQESIQSFVVLQEFRNSNRSPVTFNTGVLLGQSRNLPAAEFVDKVEDFPDLPRLSPGIRPLALPAAQGFMAGFNLSPAAVGCDQDIVQSLTNVSDQQFLIVHRIQQDKNFPERRPVEKPVEPIGYIFPEAMGLGIDISGIRQPAEQLAPAFQFHLKEPAQKMNRSQGIL